MKNIQSLTFVGMLLPLFLSAQTAVLNYSLPERVTVCDSALFAINVANPSGTDLTDLKITVELPGNLTYRTATVSGASEDNISNLSEPVFSLADIAGGQNQQLEFYVFADCEVFTAINSSVIFTAKISADFDGGNAEITTDPFPVETPFLVITKTNPRLVIGNRGDIFQREIEVRNTRLGALRNFRFRETHQAGIEVTIPLQADENPSPTIFQHTFTGTDFQTIGDGDDLFEFNESFTITEQIIITSCGDDLSFAKSKIEVDWGCRGRFCQKNETSGFVSIEENERTPELVFEPTSVPPSTCFCGPGGEITQSLKITNIGDDDAINITLGISQDTTRDTGILPGTFRMDSAGQIIRLTDVTPLINSTANNCAPSETAFEDAIVRIAALKPGVSVTVFWEAVTCQPACTQTEFNRWELETSYNTRCPPPDDQTITDYFVVTSDEIQGTAQLNILSTNPGTNSSTSDLLLWLKSRWLQSTGTLRLTMTVDSQIDLNTNGGFLLNGVLPDLTTMPGSNIFTLDYPLPFPTDSVSMTFSGQIFCDSIANLLPPCVTELVTSCQNPCTMPNDPLPSFPIEVVAQYLVNDNCDPECVPTVCFQNSLTPLCPIDSICEERIQGYIDFQYTAERENIGLLDSDDDRIADANSPADRTQIRTDRFIPGDTLLTVMNGWVVGDTIGFSATRGTASVQFNHIGPIDIANENQLFYGSGIDLTSSEIEIFDASTGNRFTCSRLPVIKNVLPNLGRYTFDISVAAIRANCNLPADFVYENGDSISVTARIRFMENLNLPEDWMGDPPSLQFNSFSSMRIFNSEDEPEFFCRCNERPLEFSNYDFKLTPKEYGLSPCGVSGFSIGDLFELRLAEGNFFPFEVRPLVQMTNYIVEPELPIDIREVQLASLNLQGNGNSFENENLAFTKNGNAFEIDLLSFQTAPLLDEGFFVFIRYKLESDCSLDGKVETDFTTNLNFLHEFPSVPIDLALTEKLDAFNILAPDLRVTSLFPDITSNDRFARWDLTIFNRITRIGSVASGEALNAFLYIETQNNVFSNFELLNVSTGQIITANNGVFQLGDLPPDVRFSYQLIGESESCDNEKLTVHFGWNCEQVSALSQSGSVCFKNELPLDVKILPGEIESILDTARIGGDLCDTLPFFTIEIFNAELGSLYDVFLETTLPPGLLVADGTSEIAHPNNAIFIKIGDPENLSGGFYKWNFSDLNDSLSVRGLPSVLRSPSNSLILRFRTITNCNFIAESFPTFNVGGFQNCEKSSNARARAAKPVSITGVTAPYGMGVSADDPVFGDCDDETVLNFRLTPDAIPQDRDSVLLTLPPGLTFIPGSYSGNANAPAGNPIIENLGMRQVLKWVISPTLQPGDQMEMEIRVRGLLSLACEREFIQLQSVATTAALCVATNENCDIRVQTGGLFIPLDINRPDLTLTNFTTEIINQNGTETVVYSVQVNNSQSSGATPVRVDFYQDANFDGIFSTGDVLIHADSLIVLGDAGILSGSFMTNVEAICGLLAVVNADENCSCRGDVLSLPGKIIRTFLDELITCSDETIEIGFSPNINSAYQWVPSDNLSCEFCAETDFSAENNSPVPIDFNYQLLETTNWACEIENNFTVTVRPKPDILLQSNGVCIGECINLETTDGTTAVWSGPGITNPNDPSPEVCPQVTTDFTAMVSDTFGCSASAQVTIDVFSLPAVDAGTDVEFCPGQMLQLNGTIEPGASGSWSPISVITNPGILNPQILATAPTTVTLTAISPDGCENSDDVFINIITGVPLEVSDDVTICKGSETTLTASGTMTYEWMPDADLACPDCPSITVMPEMTTTYTVTGSLAGFCETTEEVTVTVVTDTIKTNESAMICEGDSVLVFGNFESVAGIYQSAAFQTSTGCDSVHLITLNTSPKPAITTSTIPESCEGNCDGSITVASIDPTVTFSLSGGISPVGNVFENLCPGTYSVQWENGSGCADTELVMLTTAPKPEISATGIPEACPNSCDGTITVSSTDPTVSFSLADGTLPNGNVFENLCADTYSIQGEDANGCFSDIETITLEPVVLPDFTVTPDTVIRQGDSILLSVNIPSGVDPSTLRFQWSPSDLVLCDTCPTTLAFPEDGSTDFFVTITDENGCEVTLRSNIEANEICALDAYEIPNIFSPNGDDINDVFRPFTDLRGAVLDFVWIRVYDRWGEKVYDASGRIDEVGWDGKLKGEDAISDVYIYLIQMTCGDENGALETGDVTLYR